MQKAGQRNTQNKIVKDVKTFLERVRVLPVRLPAPAKAASHPASLAGDVPSGWADFAAWSDPAAYSTPAGYPVVFDAIPLRESVAVRTDFFAVLLPARTNC